MSQQKPAGPYALSWLFLLKRFAWRFLFGDFLWGCLFLYHLLLSDFFLGNLFGGLFLGAFGRAFLGWLLYSFGFFGWLGYRLFLYRLGCFS